MNSTAFKISSSLTRATIIIAFFSLLSRLIGLLRDRVFASQFGAGDVLDTYYAAFRVPDFLFSLLILGTLSAAFIPVFMEYLVRDRQAAHRIANTILNLTLLVMSGLAVGLAIFTPSLVSIIVPGFSEELKSQTVTLTRIMLLSPIFFSLSSVFSSILNSFKRFALVAALPIFYNLAIIFGVMVLYPRMGISGLAWGVILGAFLHMCLQIPWVYRLGFRWRPTMDLKLPGVRKIAKLFLPRMFGIGGLNQISFFVAAIIGSTLAVGSISVYNLANNLQIAPIGILAVAFATAAFPTLSEASARGDKETFQEVFNMNFSQILFLLIPLSALMIILRAQIVRLILGAGQFSWEDTILTISTLAFFSISLFAQGLIPLFSRAFYALKNTVAPVVSSLIAAGVNVIAALLLTKVFDFGVAGLALAFSIAAFVNFFLLFFWIQFKYGSFIDKQLIFKIEKIVVATILMGTVAYLALLAVAPFLDTHTVLGLLIQTAVSLFLAGISYLGFGYLLNIAESRHIIVAGKLWLNKIKTAFIRFPGGV